MKQHTNFKQQKNRTHLLTGICIGMFLFTVLLTGCTKTESTSSQESTLAQQLYEEKTNYIGSVPEINQILQLLTLPKGMSQQEEGIELQTSTEPYGLKWHLSWTESKEENAYENAIKELERNAYIFLSLVGNASYMEYELHTDKKETTILRFDAETAKAYYGTTTFSDLSKDQTTFEAFLEESADLFSMKSTQE